MTTQAPAQTKALKPIDEIRNTLMSEETKKQLLMVLPPQMPVEKFQRVAITALNKNPDLAECSRLSLYNSFMQAAQDGLLPDGHEAAIVKYNKRDGAPTAQYQPMVKGILKKIRNSGELKSITAKCIHQNDPFRYWVDDSGEHLTHEPDLFAADRGPIIGVYALAKTKDDAIYLTVLTKAEVEKVRQSSKAKDNGPWVGWWDQMAEKTAIRRLSKRMPMSTDLEEFMRRDDELFDTEATVTETEPKPKGEKGQPNRLKTMLGGAPKQIDMPTSDEEPLITPDTDQDPVATRQEELDKAKGESPASEPPSEEEQAEIKRKEAFEAKEFKCTKCPPYTFATDSEEEMTVHWQKAHPQPPQKETKKAANGGGKPSGGGGLFGT